MLKKNLGQNFLFDKSILGRIVSAAKIYENDTVVEIGPGPGTLTQILSDRVKRLIAIELDKELFKKLKDLFVAYRNVELINADALKFPYESIGDFKVVSNIPYYITTPIIFRLLEARQKLLSMTLTIQKEVAERIAASPGTKAYGVLSIMVQYYSTPELKFIIPKEAFRPVPKVDSAVVHIGILDKPAVSVKDEKLFFRLIKTSFLQRRKSLSNSLKNFEKNDIRKILNYAGIDPMRRPETLDIREFANISDIISK